MQDRIRKKMKIDFLLGKIVPFMLLHIWEGIENEAVSLNQLLRILVGMTTYKPSNPTRYNANEQ